MLCFQYTTVVVQLCNKSSELIHANVMLVLFRQDLCLDKLNRRPHCKSDLMDYFIPQNKSD